MTSTDINSQHGSDKGTEMTDKPIDLDALIAEAIADEIARGGPVDKNRVDYFPTWADAKVVAAKLAASNSPTPNDQEGKGDE